jgi:hypothetical protein
MSFNNGDIVRVGKGKVEYTVFPAPAAEGFTAVQSNNTGKVSEVETSRLVLVHSDWISDADVADAVDFTAMPVPVAIPANEVMAPWEIELLHPVTDGRPFLLTVDGDTVGFRSFERAAFELSRMGGGYTWAAIDHNGQRKAKRGTAA